MAGWQKTSCIVVTIDFGSSGRNFSHGQGMHRRTLAGRRIHLAQLLFLQATGNAT
jgi:hypothetical protein